jgi:hypothetical protein
MPRGDARNNQPLRAVFFPRKTNCRQGSDGSCADECSGDNESEVANNTRPACPSRDELAAWFFVCPASPSLAVHAHPGSETEGFHLPGGCAMSRRAGGGALFVVLCLAIVAACDAPSLAWQDATKPGEAKTGYAKEIKPEPKSFPLPPDNPLTGAPSTTSTVNDLLARLRQIKEQRAALDKEEKDIVDKIKARLAGERQNLDAAEQELRKLVPKVIENPHGIEKQQMSWRPPSPANNPTPPPTVNNPGLSGPRDAIQPLNSPVQGSSTPK